MHGISKIERLGDICGVGGRGIRRKGHTEFYANAFSVSLKHAYKMYV